MIIVADLQARQLVRLWQEAVAIVQELAEAIGRAGAALQVPDLEHVAIDATGELAILPGSPPHDHPVRQLAKTLELLLEGTSAPPELRCLVSENTGDPPKHGSVEEFTRGLAIFERPARRNDIAGVAARDPSERMESELEHLRARTRQSGESTRQSGETKATQQRSSSGGTKRWQLSRPAAAAVLLLLVGAALPASLWWRRADRSPGGTSAVQAVVSRAQEQLTSLVQAGLDAMTFPRDAEPTPVDSDPVTAESTPVPPAAPRRPDKPRAAAAALGRDAAVRGDAPRSLRSADSSPSNPVAPPPLAAGPIQGGQGFWADGASVIYSSADPEVQPPVMRRPYLPSAISQATSGVGVLEIVVSETGAVQQARLVSKVNRFRDRMLVAPAKAWQFWPALRDGQPVKYRMRVRVTPRPSATGRMPGV